MSEAPFDKAAQDAAAFQKLCMENMTKALQAAFNFSSESAPPEMLRQVRAGIFQALAQTWDEFMRSPQFLECMRRWMDGAVSFRSMTNEFLGRMRNEAQAPSRSDIDTVMLAVRHMEKRLLDRLDEVSALVAKGNGKVEVPPQGRKARRAGGAVRQSRAATPKTAGAKGRPS